MPYLGNTPTSVPLSSADLLDGIITSAKIVDGTIVNADINASAGIVASKLSGVTSGFTKLVTSTPSSVSSLDFTSTYINSTYDNYCIIGDLKPATDSVNLIIRFSASGSFLSGASDYGWESGDMGANQFTEADSDSSIKLTRAPVGNATGESISFKIFLQFPSSSGTKTSLVGQNNYSIDNNTHKAMSFGGFRNSAEVNDGIRFLFGSGNIASGNVTLYGLEK
jgi:hypothetical protein